MTANLLTVEQVAGRLNLRKETVRQEIADRNLAAVKIRSVWRIDPADLDAYLEARKVTCIQSAKRVPSRHAKSDETDFGKMARAMDGRDGVTPESDLRSEGVG